MAGYLVKLKVELPEPSVLYFDFSSPQRDQHCRQKKGLSCNPTYIVATASICIRINGLNFLRDEVWALVVS